MQRNQPTIYIITKFMKELIPKLLLYNINFMKYKLHDYKNIFIFFKFFNSIFIIIL
jgi:hypothetical protein